MTKASLVSWYLQEVAGDVESQDEMVERKQIAEKVVDRLAFTDNILIPLTRTGLTSGRKGAAEGEEEPKDPFLVVHPNYVVED